MFSPPSETEMADHDYRIHLRMPPESEDVAKRIAERRGISVNAVFRLALGVLQVMEDARRDGGYVGVSRDRGSLDQVIVAPL